MADKILKDLTIHGTTFDNYDIGDYLEVDSDNKINLKAEIVYEHGANVSVAHNAWKTVTLLTVPKTGILIASAWCRWNANATGRRTAEVHNGSDEISGYTVGASPQGGVSIFFPVVYNVFEGETFTMNFFQYSGGALTVASYGIEGVIIEK